MTTLTGFEFQCPECRVRLSIDASQRGRAICCPHCEASIAAPCYYVGQPGWRPRSLRESLPRECPGCGGPVPSWLLHATRPECPRCSHRFDFGVKAEDGSASALPVAKTFTREDRRWSLQHLMLSTDRLFVPDVAVEPRARRRFEFYCGDCGSIQVARVWEIASQVPCSVCESLVIVPAPPPGMPQHTPALRASRRSAAAGLFCPQCGALTPQADRSRHTRAYCRRCALWF